MSCMMKSNNLFKKVSKKVFLFSIFGAYAGCSAFAENTENNDKFRVSANNMNCDVKVEVGSKFNTGIETKPYLEGGVKALQFEAGFSNDINAQFRFGTDISKKIEVGMEFDVFKGSYILGPSDFAMMVNGDVKKKTGFFKYFLDNYFAINKLFLKCGIGFKEGLHKLDVILQYGNGEYVNNEDFRAVFLTSKYTNAGVEINGYRLNNISSELSFIFMPDSGLMCNKFFQKKNSEESTTSYELVGSSVFYSNNVLGSFVNLIIPSFGLGGSFESKYSDVSLKFSISPFHSMFYNESKVDFLRWAFKISAKGRIVDEKSENLSLDICFGRDELMSYWFIDGFVGSFQKSPEYCYSGENEGVFYVLARPLLFNFNLKGMYDFSPLIKRRVDFIKELSLSLSFKYEGIFGISTQDFLGNIKKAVCKENGKSASFGEMFYINIHFTPSIKFESEINGSGFSCLKNSEFNVLEADFTFKPKISCNTKGGKKLIQIKEINNGGYSFSFYVTLLNAKFKLENQALDINVKLAKLGLGEDKKFQWHELASCSLDFNIFKFINNRNK